MERLLTKKLATGFQQQLRLEEKSENTLSKYMRDVTVFFDFAGKRVIRKELVILFKQHLIDRHYAVTTINSMLAALNCFFTWLGWTDCKVKMLKVQKQVYRPEEKELTQEEYQRLLSAANKKGNEQLYLLLQTICATGIRVSELQYITVEAVQRGEAKVNCKGKTRTIFLVKKLRKKLLAYIREKGLKSGPVFVTKRGKPLDRTRIWREMKGLCQQAKVDPRKVFPHNLRHLFARVFYGIEKDIAKLADILGHSSIETTRIYIISTGSEHRKRMERMHLIL